MYVKLRENVTEEMFNMATFGGFGEGFKRIEKSYLIMADKLDDMYRITFYNYEDIQAVYEYDKEDFDKIFEEIKGDD